MMSGGDLDGDKFFVCWDKDLIPTTLHEPHTYPPAKEKPKHHISHDDLIKYFAHWSNGSMGRVANLYGNWVRGTDRGAASDECLELNHLYSLSVDGERVFIPERLRSPPKRNPEAEPFIVEKLVQQVTEQNKLTRLGFQEGSNDLQPEVIEFLAAADDICLSEFVLFQLVDSWAAKHQVSLARFINHFDFASFTTDQKSWIRTSSTFPKDKHLQLEKFLKKSLSQSTILSLQDLRQYRLDSPELHWRRLYSSNLDGERLFFMTLTTAMEDYTRKLLVLDVSAETRLKVAFLISKRIKPIEERDDTVVNDSVTAFSFRPGESGNGKRIRTTAGYRLSWDGFVFQLFNNSRGNTFVWLRSPQNQSNGPLASVSIALNRFGQDVARNVGRVCRNPVRSAEIYVISNPGSRWSPSTRHLIWERSN
jgi:hypothetical protein